MPAPGDIIHQQSVTTGTGNLTLTNVNGKRAFNDEFGTGGTDKFDYFIMNNGAAEWERGTGHLSSSTVLVRDTVKASSNANAAVNFSAGTKDVVNDIPAAQQFEVCPEAYGAVGGGSVDDTSAFTKASAALAALGGGAIRLITGRRYLVDNNLTLDAGVQIRAAKPLIAQSSGAVPSNSATLLLNTAKTITMPSSTGIDGVNVVNKGITTAPRQDTQANYVADAAAILALFAGTALTITGADVSVVNSFIGGFNQCISGSAAHRLYCNHVILDGINGLKSDAALDVSRLYGVHCYPLLTSGRATNTTEQAYWERSGIAFDFTGVNDGLTATECFSFCYAKGFEVDGGQSVILDNCWTDYFPTLNRTTVIGFNVINGSKFTLLSGCRASSVGRGLVLNTTGHTNVIGWKSWLTQSTHIEVVDGYANIVAPAMDLFGASSSVVGITVGAGSDGVRITNPFFNGFSNCWSINAGVVSTTSIIEPHYQSCTGTLNETYFVGNPQVAGSLTVFGTRIITGVDGSNFFWFKNSAGSETGNLVWNYTTDGSGNINSVSFLPRAGNGLTVKNGGECKIAGSLGRGAPVTKTADFTVAATENWLINNKAGSACTVTLPAAASYVGREIHIKTIQAQAVNSASSNVVPIGTGTAGTAILTGTAGKWATLVSDGTNWVIMNTG